MAEPLTESQENEGKVLALPGSGSAVERALRELEHVYAFFFVRVGNRPDAEDLTQMVALKALSRLRDDAPSPSIRGYLYATARSVLAGFWARLYPQVRRDLMRRYPRHPWPEDHRNLIR